MGSVPAPHASPEVTDRYVVGVDSGTLSGRTVTVRTADSAERGCAMDEHADVMDRVLTAGPASLQRGPDRALQTPRDYMSVLKAAVPRRGRRGRDRRG